jgi:tight adherence protein B
MNILVRRTRAHDERELSELAMAAARSVRTGAVLLDALAEAAESALPAMSPLRLELSEVVGAARRGMAVSSALDRWQRDSKGSGVTLLVAACRFGHAEGGDLAAALEGAALSLLHRAETSDESRALTTQARSSATVLVLLPPLGAVAFSVLDPAVARTLLGSVPGLACVIVGLSLDLCGALVLQRLIRRALR